MNFVEQEFIPKKVDKSKRTTKILLILIILVVILIVALICVIASMRETPLRITFDGESNNQIKNALLFEEDDKVYISIRDIAQYFGYESYNGDYTEKSEDTDKCYIECDNEIVNFVANSNKIEKINPRNSDSAYYLIDEPVKLIDGKLYTTPEGIRYAFNALFTYSKESNRVTIKTMQYILEGYKEKVVEWEFAGLSEDFDDSKAALDGIVIVVDNRKQYGLVNVETSKQILETKYDSISYMPVTKDFEIISNDKVGIKDANGKDKIKTNYDEINPISQDLKLYVVKQDDKYGVIDSTENSVIPIVFDQVGMDVSRFSSNKVNNKYLLLDKIIPVKRNNKWALYNIDGTRLTDLKYDQFGCVIGNSRDAKSVLVIPDYNIIVAMLDKKYILLDEDGNELGNGMGFDQVHLEIELGETTYFVTRNETTVEADKVIDRLLQME